jgi:hypothetical protein
MGYNVYGALDVLRGDIYVVILGFVSGKRFGAGFFHRHAQNYFQTNGQNCNCYHPPRIHGFSLAKEFGIYRTLLRFDLMSRRSYAPLPSITVYSLIFRRAGAYQLRGIADRYLSLSQLTTSLGRL